MKDILLVAATYGETALIRKQLFSTEEEIPYLTTHLGSTKISLIHTGIGMVNTAFHLGSYLSHHEPQLMVQFGIGGSFRRDFVLGQVVELKEEIFAEMGANSPQGFLDLKQMGFSLMKKNGHDYFNALKSPYHWPTDLPGCKGITVNEVSGIPSQISFREFKWDAEIESMEGAAFFYAALWFDIPFISLRSISNYVETRNKANWNIGLAVRNIQEKVMELLEGGDMSLIGKVRENP